MLFINGTQIRIMESDYTLQDGRFVGADGDCSYAVNGSVVTILDADGSKMVFEKK